MKKFISDLKADIVPLQSAAGIKIGLIFDDFIKYTPRKTISEQEYSSLSNTNNLWKVHYFSPHFKHIPHLSQVDGQVKPDFEQVQLL